MTDIGRKVEVRNVPKPLKAPTIYIDTPAKQDAPKEEPALVGAR